MKTINTNVNLQSSEVLPIELMMPSKEALDIFLANIPFIITVCIVIGGVTVTIFSNRKSVESQNKLARDAKEAEHENKISEFRHQWIQEVRECGAALSQLVHDIQFLIVFRNNVKQTYDLATKQDDVASEKLFGALIKENHTQLLDARSRYFRELSKLKLLFKKDEPETKVLFQLLDSVGELFYDLEKTHVDNDKIEGIISELQDVLKTEWEVTKSRSWVALNKSVKSDS